MSKVKLNDSLTKVCCVLYDSDKVNTLVEWCKKHAYKYYYIKHQPEAEKTKEHFHFCIESDSKHRFNMKSISSEEDINLFEKCNSIGQYVRYMTHCDYDEKIKYEDTDIISNVPIETIRQLIEEADPNRLSATEKSEADFNYIMSLIINGELRNLPQIIDYCLTHDIEYKRQWTYTINSLLNSLYGGFKKL